MCSCSIRSVLIMCFQAIRPAALYSAALYSTGARIPIRRHHRQRHGRDSPHRLVSRPRRPACRSVLYFDLVDRGGNHPFGQSRSGRRRQPGSHARTGAERDALSPARPGSDVGGLSGQGRPALARSRHPADQHLVTVQAGASAVAVARSDFRRSALVRAAGKNCWCDVERALRIRVGRPVGSESHPGAAAKIAGKNIIAGEPDFPRAAPAGVPTDTPAAAVPNVVAHRSVRTIRPLHAPRGRRESHISNFKFQIPPPRPYHRRATCLFNRSNPWTIRGSRRTAT